MPKTLFLALLISITSLQFVYAMNFMGMEASPAYPNVEMPKYFLYESQPGQSIEDSIKVSNLGDTTMNVRIYAVETEINSQGEEVLKPYQSEAKHLGQWVSFDNQQELNFTLETNQTKQIDFKINIPEQANKQQYQGGIMVEKLNVQDEAPQEGVVIKTNGRIGIKTFLTVTDNPREIPKLAPLKESTAWRQTYFYISLGLFVVAVGVLTVTALKKRGQKRK